MTTWVEISSVVDGMVMVEEIDEEVEEVAELDEDKRVNYPTLKDGVSAAEVLR